MSRVRGAWLVVAVLLLLALTWWVELHPLNALDEQTFGAIWRHPRAVRLIVPASAITAVLQPAVVLGLFACVALGVAIHDRRLGPVLYAVTVGGVGSVVVVAIKATFVRINPAGFAEPFNGSFPSGHTFAAVAASGGVLVLLARRVRWWQWVFVAATGAVVGGSMVLLSMHWLTDVVGGALVGVIALAGLGWPVERGLTRAPAEDDDPQGQRSRAGGPAVVPPLR